MIAAFVKEVEVHYLCCVKIHGSLIHYVPNTKKFKINMLEVGYTSTCSRILLNILPKVHRVHILLGPLQLP